MAPKDLKAFSSRRHLAFCGILATAAGYMFVTSKYPKIEDYFQGARNAVKKHHKLNLEIFA